jgi:hypothetical protein
LFLFMFLEHDDNLLAFQLNSFFLLLSIKSYNLWFIFCYAAYIGFTHHLLQWNSCFSFFFSRNKTSRSRCNYNESMNDAMFICQLMIYLMLENLSNHIVIHRNIKYTFNLLFNVWVFQLSYLFQYQESRTTPLNIYKADTVQINCVSCRTDVGVGH